MTTTYKNDFERWAEAQGLSTETDEDTDYYYVSQDTSLAWDQISAGHGVCVASGVAYPECLEAVDGSGACTEPCAARVACPSDCPNWHTVNSVLGDRLGRRISPIASTWYTMRGYTTYLDAVSEINSRLGTRTHHTRFGDWKRGERPLPQRVAEMMRQDLLDPEEYEKIRLR